MHWPPVLAAAPLRRKAALHCCVLVVLRDLLAAGPQEGTAHEHRLATKQTGEGRLVPHLLDLLEPGQAAPPEQQHVLARAGAREAQHGRVYGQGDALVGVAEEGLQDG
eukprot:5041028-Alexandrium_andersonii.AAC.1